MTHKARFLVLRGGAIGDFIVTLPALAALRERWPGAYIELIGYPHIANLALAAGLIDHVDSLDRAEMARFFSVCAAFTETQAAHIASFDLILSYLHDPQGVVKDNLLLAGARQVLYGSPIVQAGPASRHLLKPLESLAIYPESDVPHLLLPADLKEKGRQWLAERGLSGDVAAIHPGSGSPKKNWPLDRFVDVARQLEAAGRSILFVAGEADSALRTALEAMKPAPALLAEATLLETASVLANVQGYLGNDSGITHLASALGLPTVALFGPSNSSIWGPRGDKTVIVAAREGVLQNIMANEVVNILNC
ncbi:MAG TPA: hypothetical protein DCZ95_10480 [Verrucomicrobia bacterium]|nr:MAG: hypothetical protein A2X46_18660 [Lentisphaerae bacterium GWF2_57_35]HBA84508.1 hypothetical protein [Verrucomicrobiota bacterium]